MADIKRYDVIVIGSGPAGMTAALYASRANLKVAMLDQGAPGGELLNTAEVENYTGFKKVSGAELATSMYESAMAFGAEHLYGNVKQITPGEPLHRVETSRDIYEAPAVIIATGSTHRNLQVPGEEEYQGRGVSYCAVCDAAFFKDKDVVVVGGGNSAVEEGSYLSQLAHHVTVVHRRDKLRAQKILQERAFANKKMSFIWDTEVTSIEGDGQKVDHVMLRNKKTGETQPFDAAGVFIYIGLLPNNEAFKDLPIVDDHGWVETDESMRTSIPGIFAAGDVRSKNLRQISTAVGDGGLAGQGAYDYVAALESTVAK